MTKLQDFWAVLKESAPIVCPIIWEVVSWIVVQASRKMILVDLNGQFTWIITWADLTSSTQDVSEIQHGDHIEAMITGFDENSGLVLLSLRKASQIRLISKLHDYFGSKEIFTVVPSEANKGWLLVDLDGIKWFIPVSQLTPMNYPRVEGADPEKILAHLNRLVGKAFKVRVINVDEAGKKIIFSEKAWIEEDRSKSLEWLKIGNNVEWTVSGILTYWLFVTFEWLEWLVHVSEIDWWHVSDPSKYAKVGDKINVQIIWIDSDKISLSMKRLKANPWTELAKLCKVGDIIEAPVERISKFGIFLALPGGISWLVHLSEISNSIVKEIDSFVKVGEKVKVKIITFVPEEKRIWLSMKALEEWTSIEETEKKPKKEAKKEEIKEEVIEEKVEKKAPKKKEEKAEEVKEKIKGEVLIDEEVVVAPPIEETPVE